MGHRFRDMVCRGAVVCGAAGLFAPAATARDGVDIGRNSAGRIVAVIEAAQPFPMPVSPFPGVEGYATGAIGFTSVEVAHPHEDLHPLDAGSDIRIELVSAEDGLVLYFGPMPMSPGDSGVFGPPFFDFHLIFNMTGGAPGTVRSLVVRFRDSSGLHADSEEVAMSFVAAPACPGDADGDGVVGLSDIAAIIACWGEHDHCDHGADLDFSRDIGLGDAAVVIRHWGATCP